MTKEELYLTLAISWLDAYYYYEEEIGEGIAEHYNVTYPRNSDDLDLWQNWFKLYDVATVDAMNYLKLLKLQQKGINS